MEVTDAEGTYLCPAINSAMLKPFSQRINRCLMSIVDKGDVAMEMKGKLQTGNPNTSGVEVTKELIYISSDGMKIQVYQNAEGVHCFGGVPLSGMCREYVYPNFPARLWKKYLHAYKFVEVVKSKTSKIVLITDRAKCKLMENGPVPDFEAHFHDGVRILLSKAKIHITESHGGTMTLDAGCLKDRVTERTMQMIEYTLLCQAECHRIHESLIAVQARDNLINVFPVTIGSIHNPFFISQQTCESVPLQGAKHDSHLQNFSQGTEPNQCHHNFSPYPPPLGDDLNVRDLHMHTQWPSGVEWQYTNMTSPGFDSPCDVVGHENSNVLSTLPQNNDIGMRNQEMCEYVMTEMDMSHQSDSSVPCSLPCQSENTTCFHHCYSRQNFSTPTKCQTKSNANQKRCFSEGSTRVKSQTRDFVFPPPMENALQSPSVKRNLFVDSVLEDSLTNIISSDYHQSSRQELQEAAPLDILDHCCKETSLNAMPKVCENVDRNNQQPHEPLQQQDILSHSIDVDEKRPCQHPSIDSGVDLDTSEMTQMIHKFENFCYTSEMSEKPSGGDEGKVLEHSMNSSSPHRHGCISKEVLSTPSSSLIQNSSLFPSESNLTPFCPKPSDVHLHPPQSSSPQKISRKVAPSSAPSTSLKYDNFDLATIDENQLVSTTSDKSLPETESNSLESMIEPSSSGDFSCAKLNVSLPNSLGIRKGMNLRNYQEKLNTSLPQCMSPSHSKLMPNYPLSPQKEFLQGGREWQSMDNTLPPQVRNSLDMSISSYYSDSPSSSPSSGCDPIYQVFVPYIGWASYYAGGAIWVLYNDGTQLGVKATEAVMTFIDQDGTQKKFKNSDVVPEIVKMKLEKLPNVLKTVMKNKDSGKTS